MILRLDRRHQRVAERAAGKRIMQREVRSFRRILLGTGRTHVYEVLHVRPANVRPIQRES